MKNKSYIFTNRKHSPKSIMSTILGIIADFSILFTIHLSFHNKGVEDIRYGAVCTLSLVFAFIGLCLAIAGRLERDKFYLFAYIGMVLCLVAFGLASIILYAGALLNY